MRRWYSPKRYTHNLKEPLINSILSRKGALKYRQHFERTQCVPAGYRAGLRDVKFAKKGSGFLVFFFASFAPLRGHQLLFIETGISEVCRYVSLLKPCANPNIS